MRVESNWNLLETHAQTVYPQLDIVALAFVNGTQAPAEEDLDRQVGGQVDGLHREAVVHFPQLTSLEFPCVAN